MSEGCCRICLITAGPHLRDNADCTAERQTTHPYEKHIRGWIALTCFVGCSVFRVLNKIYSDKTCCRYQPYVLMFVCCTVQNTQKHRAKKVQIFVAISSLGSLFKVFFPRLQQSLQVYPPSPPRNVFLEQSCTILFFDGMAAHASHPKYTRKAPEE